VKTRGQLIGENNFVNQTRVTENMVVFGELKPLIAGSKQETGAKLPENIWKTNIDRIRGIIYFALRSLDSAVNKAKLSNIANANFVYDQIIRTREYGCQVLKSGGKISKGDHGNFFDKFVQKFNYN
jgi:hypothetical protein